MDVNPNGAWKRYKTPLIIFLLATALFIFYTQQETFNILIASITTVTAAIPLVFKLISMISGANINKKPQIK